MKVGGKEKGGRERERNGGREPERIQKEDRMH